MRKIVATVTGRSGARNDAPIWRPYAGAEKSRMRPCERPVRLKGAIQHFRYQNGEELGGVYVNCQQCESCVARKVHDLTGRAIAESIGSERAFFSTHTIGGDNRYGAMANNPLAIKLDRSLMQAFIKRLRYALYFDARERHRAAGMPAEAFVAPRMRFFVVGEYGDQKGRAHYHMVSYLWGVDAPPEFDMRCLGHRVFHGAMAEFIDTRMATTLPGVRGRTYWPYGDSQWSEFYPNDARYVAKYATKSAEEWAGGDPRYRVMRPGRSTRPMLGAFFFDWLAGQLVELGVPFTDRHYEIPREVDPWRHRYFMNRAALMTTGRAYERRWHERAAADRNWPREPPGSDLLDKFHHYEFKRLEALEDRAIAREQAAEFRRLFREGLARRAGEAADVTSAASIAQRIRLMWK